MEDLKLAILIDADNISSKYIKTLMDEAANEGVITYKRIYGDWTKPNLNSWKEELLAYSITPIQQYAYTTGKNSTDSAMIIDAMDILYSGKVDGFILVSSDSDFTRLAARLKESAMLVIGMGNKQTPKPFVVACSKFKFLDVLSNEESDVVIKNEIEEVDEEKTEKKGKAKDKKAKEKNADKSKVKVAETSSQTPLEEIINTICRLIEKNSDDDGWVLASDIGNSLPKIHSDFDVRNYNAKKLNEFLTKNGFELKSVDDPNNVQNPNGKVVYVRIKK